MANRTDGAGRGASEGLNILSILFTGLAFICIAGGVVTLLYEGYGFVTGNGWNVLPFANLMDWLLGPPPATSELNVFTTALALLALMPQGLTLLVLGFVLSRAGDLFERLS